GGWGGAGRAGGGAEGQGGAATPARALHDHSVARNAPLGEPPPQTTFTSEPTWKNGGWSGDGRTSPGSSSPSSCASTLIQPGVPSSMALTQSTSVGTPPVVSV